MSVRRPHRGLRRVLWLLAALALLTAVLPVAGAAAGTAGSPDTYNLIADGGTAPVDVGEVQVWDDGATLYVKYVIDPGADGGPWCITATHVDVAQNADELAQSRKGNPKIGKFAYQVEHDPCVTEHTQSIALGDHGIVANENIYIAAHADVFADGGLDALELALPTTANLNVAFPGGDSYFNSTVTNGGVLNGTSDGWCVDTSRSISPGTTYDVNVFSSYEALPAGTVDHPEHLDLVNWIINQNYPGTLSPGGPGNYTYGDVQRAIWHFIEDTQSTAGLGSWNQNRVDEIVAAAELSGDGFEPGCGDVVAVILVPVNSSRNTVTQITIAQVKFVSVGVPCEDREETAWSGVWNGSEFDSTFGGGSWAGYFAYTTEPET